MSKNTLPDAVITEIARRVANGEAHSIRPGHGPHQARTYLVSRLWLDVRRLRRASTRREADQG
jgi:hypothetical protein